MTNPETIPPRQVWTRLGAMSAPGPVADIIDDLLGVCRGTLTAHAHLFIYNPDNPEGEHANTPPWLIALEETLTACQPSPTDSEGAEDD